MIDAEIIEHLESFEHFLVSIGRFAGFTNLLAFISWGSAAHHPRLYASGRSAGFPK